jgi:hypothetical protein
MWNYASTKSSALLNKKTIRIELIENKSFGEKPKKSRFHSVPTASDPNQYSKIL